MIPKIIHYCWFGEKPYSETISKCIATWEKYLPGYEFKLWNENNSPMNHPFVKQAYKSKKYAFVADYVRFWALYNDGGVYLDTDMYLIKNLDDFLIDNEFFGYENPNNDCISAGIIGAYPNNEFIFRILKEYDLISFENNNIDNIKIPGIITQVYSKYENRESIKIYPSHYFYPFPWEYRKDLKNFLDYKTDQTYAIHLWDQSWYTWKDFFIRKYFSIKRKLSI
jgi:mannosyltransferase OCH1-like enzyme